MTGAPFFMYGGPVAHKEGRNDAMTMSNDKPVEASSAGRARTLIGRASETDACLQAVVKYLTLREPGPQDRAELLSSAARYLGGGTDTGWFTPDNVERLIR